MLPRDKFWAMMLSEISQPRKDKYCMILLIWGADPQFVESIDEEPADTEGQLHYTWHMNLSIHRLWYPEGVLGISPPETLRDSYARIS